VFSDILKLIKQSVAYGGGHILIAGTGILLIPVYTRVLTVSDYGIIGSLAPISALLMYFYNLGMSGAVMRFDAAIPNNETRRIAHGTAWVFILIMACTTSVLVALIGAFTWDLVFPSIPFLPFALLMLGTAAFDATNVVPLALLRIRGRAVTFSVLQFLKFLTLTSLIILFVVFLKWGVEGQFTAVFLTSLIFSVAYIVITIRFVKVGLDFSYLKKYLAFGLPTVLSGLFIWILSQSNLLILMRMTSLEQVGLYALGFKFGLILDMLSIAILTAWQPFFYIKAATNRGPELFSQVGTYFLFVVLGVGTAILLCAQPLLHIATTPKFFGAGQVVGFLLLGSFFKALYLFNVQGISFKMKTKYLMYIDGTAAALSVGCSLILIPKYGMMGAAFSTMITYFVQFSIAFIVSRSLYPIPYQYIRLLKILFIYGFILWTLNQLVFDSDIWTLVIRLVLFPMAVLLGLILLRIPEERETQKVMHLMQRLKLRSDT
jgi:O-antigen/teichoic acid export membrane protein